MTTKPTEAQELLPCPCCGSTDINSFDRVDANTVTCKSCGLSLKQSSIGMGDAPERWNRRASLAATPAEPVEPVYLLNGARVKLNFNGVGNMTSLSNMRHDLQGRWVALVAAENDMHLKAAAPPAPVAQPLSEARSMRITLPTKYRRKGDGDES
jgi:hypothetical protein